ncbi:hypothetical protein BC940DRAFT_310792 [Gongronella butleri]|nr:hypothetical protein BC940DRAFT_310792 [Gongronella butleri]
MASFTSEQCKVFEEFKAYDWEKDKVFQAGVANILKAMAKPTPTKAASPSPHDADYDEFRHGQQQEELLQVLRAKHFYFNKFKEPFSLDEYLAYELEEDKKEQEQRFERVEVYDFDNDERYLQGLPNIIQGWVNKQLNDGKNGKLWDKARLDLEYTKTKAVYYSSCIEKVDVGAYMLWKHDKESKEVSVCPFANLWQNKGKADLGPQLISDDFLCVDVPKSTGGYTIAWASPATRNLLTAARLTQLSKALDDAGNDDNVTSLFLTATVADTASPFDMGSPDKQIETKDTKTISQGVAYDATYRHVRGKGDDKRSHDDAVKAVDHLNNVYTRQLIQQLLTSKARAKPTVAYLNGSLPLHVAPLMLWPGYLRVATEHALIPCHVTLGHAPAPPLLLYTLCQQRMAARKPVPGGYFAFLALAPPELARLRAPELLRIGLVDVFVPENQLNDVILHTKRMAFCPEPNTSMAVQMILSMFSSYPGPERVSTWQNAIEQVFGDVHQPEVSFATVLGRLEQLDNAWSKQILEHWATLPPVLLKAIFKATQQVQEKSPSEILALEEGINRAWRQSADYQQFCDGKRDWQSSLDADDDAELVNAYFEARAAEPSDDTHAFEYEISSSDVIEAPTPAMVCPVTGQASSADAKCPVTGQSNVAAKCPVTGQSNADAKCPVTGQSSSEAKCPVTGQNNADAKCPVSGQSSADANKCPVTGQSNSGAKCPVTGQTSATGTCPAADKPKDA